MTKVLVTGSSGFIGSHLCRTLEARGDQVFTWDRVWRDPAGLGHANYPEYDLHVLDDAGRKKLLDAVYWVHQVYHLAGNADVGAYDREPDLMAREWIMAAQVIGACLLHKKPLVVASSAYANGANTAYGLTKRGIEQMCQLARRDDTRVSVARIYNIYGPGQERAVTYTSAVVLNLYRAFKKGDWSLKHPSAKRDFVYIQDAIEMLLHVMDKTISHDPRGVGEICSGELTSIFILGNLMSGNIMDHPGLLDMPEEEEAENPPYLGAGLAYLAPKVSLEEGLRRTIAHLEETA